ncbi:putative Proline dehydrogenase [Candidatus Terasakiella magnetica]|uniref:Putative Proline dehydrogenase n=1 Tax=Candidatus Terasakiella magnetica TaxID=1867952 RepID=A0A1C3RJR5_9PROT|nr:proline dehydrogenase family protein [Candidatus Terasakiella magnetica]SCA57530.1 putative Proline dehydrogenase [Candidatus Terasakiella magnetica]
MGFKKKLAGSSMVRYLAQNTPLMHGMAKKLVPATEMDEAVDVARKLLDMGYHVCLHHLGKASKDIETIQENVSTVMETMEILDEERLEVCVTLTPSEMGYLKSTRGGEGHCRQIGQIFGNRISVRDVEDRQGYGDGKDEGERNLLMIHASERVAMQRVLALYGSLFRSDVPACVTIPAGLTRSIDDVKTIISQGGNVRLSMTPFLVSDASSYEYEDLIADNYMKLARLLLSEDAMIQQVKPVFALEDNDMAEQIIMMANMEGWPFNAFEFEIPYGVNNALKRKLLEEGYNVRVLIPFGKEWWPYFQKRSE